jgi:hypothetical protein
MGDDQGLAQRVTVPCGAGAGLKMNMGAGNRGTIAADKGVSMRTSPVKVASGPKAAGALPLRVICMGLLPE